MQKYLEQNVLDSFIDLDFKKIEESVNKQDWAKYLTEELQLE